MYFLKYWLPSISPKLRLNLWNFCLFVELVLKLFLSICQTLVLFLVFSMFMAATDLKSGNNILSKFLNQSQGIHNPWAPPLYLIPQMIASATCCRRHAWILLNPALLNPNQLQELIRQVRSPLQPLPQGSLSSTVW